MPMPDAAWLARSPTKRRLLSFIVRYHVETRGIPTLDEMRDVMGWAGISSVSSCLRALRGAGYLERPMYCDEFFPTAAAVAEIMGTDVSKELAEA